MYKVVKFGGKYRYWDRNLTVASYHIRIKVNGHWRTILKFDTKPQAELALNALRGEGTQDV